MQQLLQQIFRNLGGPAYCPIYHTMHWSHILYQLSYNLTGFRVLDRILSWIFRNLIGFRGLDCILFRIFQNLTGFDVTADILYCSWIWRSAFCSSKRNIYEKSNTRHTFVGVVYIT
jgi:hypothetical protein